MIQKKSVISAAAFFVVMALTVGYFALASDIGGRENPLVTLDYLKSLDPQIEGMIEAAVREKVDAEEQRFRDMLRQAQDIISSTPSGGVNMDDLLNDDAFVAGIAAEIADIYGLPGMGDLESSVTRLSIRSGTTIRLAQGARIMRRGGAAEVVNVPSGQAGLINLTDGSVLPGGGALLENNEYTVTFENGREIRCTADSVFFIWGSFN
jgi:hypothetical protein